MVSLDISYLLLGAMFRGQFKKHLKLVLHDIQDLLGEVILFVDKLHTIVGKYLRLQFLHPSINHCRVISHCSAKLQASAREEIPWK